MALRTVKLRPYQDRAISAIREAFAGNQAVLLALQVGGGKTVIACEIIRRVIERRRRALFIAHRVELVEQARDRLAAFGIEAGIIKAGFREQRELPVQVACVPSLARRQNPPADLVIFDEAHHVVSDSWIRLLDHYRDRGAWILGITATPQRLDGKGLGAAFDTIVEPVTTRELIDGGFLIEPDIYAPPAPDLRGVRTRGGDYALPQLAERMDKLTGSITDYWREHCQGKRTLAFAVNVEHSLRIEEALAEAGARVVHIDGTTPVAERKAANDGLRSGAYDVVTQCQLWTEGLDIPELEALIIARPTKSLSLHRQIVGRVMRTAPGKTSALVLDHAGNHHEHGLVTEPVEWSLDRRLKREAVPSVSTCQECYAVMPPGAERCPACGAERPQREEATPPGVDNPGELVRLDMRPKKASKTEKEAFYRERVREASARGYTVGWARFRYKERFGVWPRLRAVEVDEYRCDEHEFEYVEHGPKMLERCKRCYVDKLWVDILRMKIDERMTWAAIGAAFGHSGSWAAQIGYKAAEFFKIEDSDVPLGYRKVDGERVYRMRDE